MNLNQNICNNLTNDNFRHIYKIYLEKDKKYFISLQSNNDMEFNLRIYDINKNIIKSKYDKHDENSFIADIKNDIEYSEVIETESDDNYEDYNELDKSYTKIYDSEKDLDKLMNLNIFNENNDFSLFKDKNLENSKNENIDNLTQKLFIDTIDAIDSYNKKLIDSYEVLDNENTGDCNMINFNNKQYFSPMENNYYLLSVSSDYENYEGEYTLLVKEVEDITYSSSDKIKINENIDMFFKKKFDSKKLFVELTKNVSYEINCSSNVKVLINKDSQKIISKFNSTNFIADFNGIYDIEIISLENKINCSFQINEIYPEFKENKLDVVKAKKIILKDEYGKDFELSVKNRKLVFKSYKN